MGGQRVPRIINNAWTSGKRPGYLGNVKDYELRYSYVYVGIAVLNAQWCNGCSFMKANKTVHRRHVLTGIAQEGIET